MRRASLTLRVAIAAAAAIVIAVVVLGAAVLTRLGDQLEGSLDTSLRERAVEVARLAASTPDLLTEPGTLEGRLGGSELLVQVVDRRGRIVARSSGLGSRVLPETAEVRAALDNRRAGYGDAALGTDPIRLYTAPLGELGRGTAAGGAVIVAGTTSEMDDTLATTRRFVLIAAVFAAVLAAAMATTFAYRALAPLRRLSSGARDIERSGDASERLPVPAARDEVGELAETLNAMLASLQRAREAEQRFVGDASHELRTPLTALRGNAGYIARHGPDPDVLADIEADAARLSALLDDLLALAREDAAAPLRGEAVDLAELARQAAAADGRAEALGTPAHVLAERPALERAVGNLVDNARKHGPPDGAITITTGAGDRAWIAVEDEGSGLPRGEAAEAFDRFWRGRGARGVGSGLGLAIVRAIAERHGGRVTVDRARFTIELPALKDLSTADRRNRSHDETTSPRE
ncbi:MAG TPA: HAMP domain-containing sensor histidine kinase [Solirubrobacteraceae bacterium]|nr:HAMP domain-containing sensor histidine kinase [Solirubrobacteraceae bacterium]